MKAKHKQAGRFPYAVKWAEKLFEQGDPSERKEKNAAYLAHQPPC